jgi:hypothetical protein
MSSASSSGVGERPVCCLEKILSPLTEIFKEPGAPARSLTGTPNSRSIEFLRLTASALMSAQKKQRLISMVIVGSGKQAIKVGEFPQAASISKGRFGCFHKF